MQITANFNSIKDQMRCPCCQAFIHDERFMKRLQILRDLMCVPFICNSFYRCRFYNNEIGGKENSQHLMGRAMDISSVGWNGNVKWNFIHDAMKLGFSLGYYDDFFHLDLRPGKPVTWFGK